MENVLIHPIGIKITFCNKYSRFMLISLKINLEFK